MHPPLSSPTPVFLRSFQTMVFRLGICMEETLEEMLVLPVSTDVFFILSSSSLTFLWLGPPPHVAPEREVDPKAGRVVMKDANQHIIV